MHLASKLKYCTLVLVLKGNQLKVITGLRFYLKFFYRIQGVDN